VRRWKAVEIARWKERFPLARLMMQMNAAQPSRDFIGALRGAQERTGKPGLIAEVKKASPSRGIIQPNFDPVRVSFPCSFASHLYATERSCLDVQDRKGKPGLIAEVEKASSSRSSSQPNLNPVRVSLLCICS